MNELDKIKFEIEIKQERDLWHINKLNYECKCCDGSCFACKYKKQLISIFEREYKPLRII